MELFIVRHGRPEEHVVDAGTADPALTELGQRQSEALADYLVDEGIDHIISSPMRRARETAQPLCDRLGLSAEIIDDFKESDYQSAAYKPVETNRDELIEAFMNDPEHIFGSDGRDAFFARVDRAFREVITTHGGKSVAIFCHGMVTAAWVTSILGLNDPFSMTPDYTGLTRMRASTKHNVYSVRSFNETMHLRGLPDVRW